MQKRSWTTKLESFLEGKLMITAAAKKDSKDLNLKSSRLSLGLTSTTLLEVSSLKQPHSSDSSAHSDTPSHLCSIPTHPPPIRHLNCPSWHSQFFSSSSPMQSAWPSHLQPAGMQVSCSVQWNSLEVQCVGRQLCSSVEFLHWLRPSHFHDCGMHLPCSEHWNSVALQVQDSRNKVFCCLDTAFLDQILKSKPLGNSETGSWNRNRFQDLKLKLGPKNHKSGFWVGFWLQFRITEICTRFFLEPVPKNRNSAIPGRNVHCGSKYRLQKPVSGMGCRTGVFLKPVSSNRKSAVLR